MSVTLNQDLATRILSQVSRSFYLTLRLLPAPMREPISLAYLVARFSDTLADTESHSHQERVEVLNGFEHLLELSLLHPSSPNLRAKIQDFQVRLAQAWIPSQTHAGERELLQSVEKILWACQQVSQHSGLGAILMKVWKPIFEGQKEDLVHFPNGELHALPDAAALWKYTWQVAGCVGVFWTEMGLATLGKGFSRDFSSEQLVENATQCGRALQLVNILRDIPKDLSHGRCYLPLEEIEDQGLSLEAIKQNPALLEPLARRWIQHAETALRSSPFYLQAMSSWRIRWATALPFALAIETLQRLKDSSWLDWAHGIKVPRSEVFSLLRTACWNTRSRRAAERWLQRKLERSKSI